MTHTAVEAIDDLLHPPGADADFSESYYFQFGQPNAVCGFVRIANRPNEGRGERTVCLFLPDGRAVVSFARPTFADAAIFDAAGMRLDMRTPLVQQRVTFRGEVHLLDTPTALADPGALRTSPRAELTLELDVVARAPAHHFTLDADGDFAPHHFDQFTRVTGAFQLADGIEPLDFSIDAHGMRDHGWGRRSWGAPRYYRWLYACGPDFGFAAGVLNNDGTPRTGGFVWDGTHILPATQVTVTTEWHSRNQAARIEAVIVAGGRNWVARGHAARGIPMRHSTSEGKSRLLFSPVTVDVDGHRLTGQIEHVDRITDDGLLLGVEHYDARSLAQQ